MFAPGIRRAAEAGVPSAQTLYGQMLLDGAGGVARDPRAGFGWFVRAARGGELMALNMVGRCYDLGWGTRTNKARAAACFRTAAERGLVWAMYNYATLLALGEGVPEDKAAALDWLRKAAAGDDDDARAKAINFIGGFYEDGWVVARDMDEAARCYAQAAEGGDFRGQFNHARMLLAKGELARACLWLKWSSANGTPEFRAKAHAWLVCRGWSLLAKRHFAC